MRLHVVAQGFEMPDRMPAFPPAREFLLSAGFGGAAALVAALVIAVVAWLLARAAAKRYRADFEQRERHHHEVREEEQRAAAIARCWQRLVWVVDAAGLEPAGETATLGLGPELAVEILRGLLRDAEQLGDETLAGAVTVHLNQFSLVLARQAGPLSDLTATPAGARPAVLDPAPPTSPKAGASAAIADADAAAASSAGKDAGPASGSTPVSEKPVPAATHKASSSARRRAR
jgi:hypothetical protein